MAPHNHPDKTWMWKCSCGGGGKKPNRRWLAKHYGNVHIGNLHNGDESFEITIYRVK